MRDEKSADKLGRGLNIPCVWFDEFAFLNLNKTTYMAARPALNKASEAAEAVHQPHGILITSTPNNLDMPEGLFCHQMIQKACKLTDDWYDWEPEQLKEFLDKNSGNNYAYVEYTYDQLGKDEKWLKAQIKALEGDMAKVKREILIEWTYASDISIFTEEQLDTMAPYVKKEYPNAIYIDNYKIDIVENDFNNLMYKNWMLSIDIAGGLGKDYSAFTLIDPLSYKIIMKFKNNTIQVLEFADLIIKFVKMYVPNAIIVPERNNSGIPFIEKLQKSDIAKNLYYISSDDPDYTKRKINKKFSLKKNGSGNSTETRIYGFNTDKTKRKVMTEEILFMLANSRPELVNNQELFDEMRKLIRERSGKINHINGEHDDLLMSYLIGLYVLIYSSNRNKFFKNISNEPINEKTKTTISKENKQFKTAMSLNNPDKLNLVIQSGSIDPELIEMQNLINQKKAMNEKTNLNTRSKKIKNIFKMNSM